MADFDKIIIACYEPGNVEFIGGKMNNDLRQLEEAVQEAVQLVYKNDKHLIQYHCNFNSKTGKTRLSKKDYHVNERSIVFRFGCYLQSILCKRNLFTGYDLDCEYNRNGDQPKKLPRFENGTYPDIILHKRGSNEENTLVMEFKGYWCKASEALENDMKKIEMFTKQQGIYKFSVGMLVFLGKRLEDTKIKVVVNGYVDRVICLTEYI